MSFVRLVASRHVFACGVAAAGLLAMASDISRTADAFPFEQDLMLDASPMLPAKRMPTLNVAPDGNATIGLWCKTVTARVELSDQAIKIEPGPLPEALPEMMGNGQCAEPRVQADQEMLVALSQVTAWRSQGREVILVGWKTLKFRPASN